MKKYEKIISAVKQGSPFLEMIRLGLKPEEIKKVVIKSLEPYFDNKDILVQFAIDVLVPESINLLKLQKQESFFEMFQKCLSSYRLSKTRDSKSCFESCALWRPQINQTLTNFWSAVHLEFDKCALEMEEFLHECFRNIGDIIEGITKPYLKALLHQIRIARGAKATFEDIDSLELGILVNELIRTSGYPQLFVPPPWNIRLNQWRNIAYHHTATIENNDIICCYGKAPNVKRIRLSRSELLRVVQTTFDVYRTLRLADTLFFIDNIREIRKFPFPTQLRDEAEFINFAAGLASQGFEIVNYEKNPNKAKLVVKDISDLNPDDRRAHSSQFLFPLWFLTRSRKVIVEYREKDGTPSLRVSANSNNCERVYSGELEWSSLAKIIDMVNLKTREIVPPIKDD